MNVVALTGRLTSDPELRKTPGGVSITRFTIAVDRNYTPKGEEKKVDFIDCVAWRNEAEFLCNYFRKGQMIAVNGEINTDSYEKDGVKRKKWEIKVDNISFCGSKADGNSTAAPEVAPPKPKSTIRPINDNTLCELAEAEEDELPF